MVMSLLSVGRAHRGLHGDHPTAGGPGLPRRAPRQRPKRSGGRRAEGGGGGFFGPGRQGGQAGGPAGRAGGGATRGGEKWPRTAVAGPGRLPSDRPLEGRGRSPLSGKGAITGEPVRSPSWRASL